MMRFDALTVVVFLSGVAAILLGLWLGHLAKKMKDRRAFLIDRKVFLAMGVILLFVSFGVAVLNKRYPWNPYAPHAAVKVVEVPRVRLMKNLEWTGRVTTAPAAIAGRDTVVLVVRLDPMKDSTLEFVPAIAPLTQSGKLWTSGERVKVMCFEVYLTDMGVDTRSAWFVQ